MSPHVLTDASPVAPAIEMHGEPLGENCRRILPRGEHALIGVSAGNSYFNQDRLTGLLDWAERSFEDIDVVYVDTALDEMLLADGRTPESAAKSVKATVRDVRRRIKRARERLGPQGARIRVRALSEIMELPAYQAVRRETDRAFREDPEFAATCRALVRDVVEGRSGTGAVTEAHLRAGLAYVQAEAPLFTDCPAIFGVPTSVVLYHMKTPISEYLAGSPEGFRAAPGQGYAIVRPRDWSLAEI
ncbi:MULTISPECIES: tRNA-dependent cyclodipeptide synthase [Streptomyces]|uniref:tRNA-dependent cyclodipeptide synthase n=1 Tax=Streptomyces TaxID=1883 RepID=UPI00163D14B0|nr:MULTISPECIES: tRNA-dependent cyclodipeptide synthase [Streptomyces]MBC2877234.1 tRNA-dependent cyclodipeptide synthase [Streptomyces sp. TYQ1024]UBI39500.1 tRNA-dependent cyclodipeptide synthase [Streptomyces mobaraensis]UKW32079.1 tRNA-dependent cyclodipeptide synthase [Streptomyces sp. TYQ1024]